MKKRFAWNRTSCCGRFFSLKDLRYKRVLFTRIERLVGEGMHYEEDEWYTHKRCSVSKREQIHER